MTPDTEIVDLGELTQEAPAEARPPRAPLTERIAQARGLPWPRITAGVAAAIVACSVAWQLGAEHGQAQATRAAAAAAARTAQAGGRAPVQFGPDNRPRSLFTGGSLSGSASADGAAASLGGLDGVFVQTTSSAAGGTLVLTNRTSGERRIGLLTNESDGFRLEVSPAGPHLLAPGASTSIFLTIKVLYCADSGRLSNWSDGIALTVTDPAAADGAFGGSNDPARSALRDVLLAPLGAAVQKSCG